MAPDSTTANGNNQRVTNAVLQSDIKHLAEKVEGWHLDSCRRLDDVEKRASNNELNLARLDERQKTTTGALGVLSVIGNTIAAAIGAAVK